MFFAVNFAHGFWLAVKSVPQRQAALLCISCIPLFAVWTSTDLDVCVPFVILCLVAEINI